ncbi:MAG: IS1595 family transposase [Burkholderiaceae bacterium]
MAEAILNQPQFQDADQARQYLEALRWPNGAVCPHCGSAEQHYKLEGKATRPGVYKCSDCRDQFTVTVGTVFEDSKVPLNKWLQACYLMASSKKGISSKQLERMLGVSYKTAWFMSHRIREAMTNGNGGLLGSNCGAVEVDETYWGNVGKQREGARGGDHKMKVLSLVDRTGEKRSFHVTAVNVATLRPILKAQIDAKARLMTDEASVYKKIGIEFASHESVNHSAKEYARRDITTNTVESSFAILKRGLYGTFHSVSEKHLQRYANEFDFRWNNRAKLGFNDTQRADNILKGIGGKRLMYRHSLPLGATPE